MKITKEHFDHMKVCIEKHDTAENRAAYASGNYPNAHRTKDVNKRYRWDLLLYSTSKMYEPTTKWLCDTLYPYLDDEHIDTALRHIVKPLETT